MERASLIQVLREHGFVDKGVTQYGFVKGYPVVVTVPVQADVKRCTAVFTPYRTPKGQHAKLIKLEMKTAGIGYSLQPGNNAQQPMFTFNENKCGSLEQITSLLEKAAAVLEQNSAPTKVHCCLCGETSSDAAVMYQGQYQPVHQHCAHEDLENSKVEMQASGSYLLGILGAVVGGLLGCIPTVISIVYFQMLWSILFALIPLGAYYGYKLCGGKMNNAVIVATVLISIISVYVVELVSQLLEVSRELGIHLLEVYEAVTPLFFDFTFWVELTEDAGSNFLFMAFGVWIAWGQVSRTNRSRLKQAQQAIDTLALVPGAVALKPEAPVSEEMFEGNTPAV